MSNELVIIFAVITLIVSYLAYQNQAHHASRDDYTQQIYYIVSSELNKALDPIEKDLARLSERLVLTTAVTEENKIGYVALRNLVYRINGDLTEIHAYLKNRRSPDLPKSSKPNPRV